MVQFIRVNGSLTKIRKTAEESKFGLMVLDMMDFGETAWPMAMQD